MITAILGRAGSGKSYESVRWIRRAVKAGRCVVTTVPLADVDEWRQAQAEGLLIKRKHLVVEGDERMYYGESVKHWNEWLSPELRREDIETGETQGPLIVLDECALVFRSFGRKGAEELTARVKEIIATHRHHLLDLIWIAQTHLQLPVELKKQIEEWIELGSTRKMGIKGGYVWAQYGTWYPPREKLTGGFRKYDKTIFTLYDSHALGGGSGVSHGEKSSLFANKPWWLQTWFLLLIPTVAGAIYFVPKTVGFVMQLMGGEGAGTPIAMGGVAEAATEVSGSAIPENIPGSETSASAGVEAGSAPAGALQELRVYGEWSGWPGGDVVWEGRRGGDLIWADGTWVSVDVLEQLGVRVRAATVCRLVLERAGARREWRGDCGGVAAEEDAG